MHMYFFKNIYACGDSTGTGLTRLVSIRVGLIGVTKLLVEHVKSLLHLAQILLQYAQS